MDKLSILIGADIVPTDSNIDLFRSGSVRELIGEGLQSVLHAADCRIFNLETPFCDELSPIAKNGPALHAPKAAANGIRKLGLPLLILANNHIMDQGAAGFESTIETLKEYDIPFVGAGEDLNVACRPFVLEQKGIRIGIYACAEHEFSIAEQDAPGANPFDPLESPDHVYALKAACDYVIVLYHGGKEHYRYPSPGLRKTCRKLAEKGADLVVCQHSHCIGCRETYMGGTIVYGQGNFLFDGAEDECWQTGLLLRAEFGERMELSYIPVVRERNTVRLADGHRADEILMQFERRSEQILEPGFVERTYGKFASENFAHYLTALHGGGLLFRICNRLSGHRLVDWIYPPEKLAEIRNYVECEDHRELIVSQIKNTVRRFGNIP